MSLAYEDRPEKDTPRHIQEELRDFGGVSPDGQPVWRLVRSENCRILCFGTMNHIQRDLSKLDEFARPTDVVPDRIEEGSFWVPRYRVKGWILQRWWPPLAWGSREKWESEKARDGRTRLLAAFPQRGDYQMVPAGPWKTLDQVGDLKAAIRVYNTAQRRNPARWDSWQQAQMVMEEKERQDAADAYYQEMCAQHAEALAGPLRTVSQSAQVFRNVVAKHTAGGMNLGASEKWG